MKEQQHRCRSLLRSFDRQFTPPVDKEHFVVIDDMPDSIHKVMAIPLTRYQQSHAGWMSGTFIRLVPLLSQQKMIVVDGRRYFICKIECLRQRPDDHVTSLFDLRYVIASSKHIPQTRPASVPRDNRHWRHL